jgi:two-component system, cell cycle sensor histidine kinase and response regulator CckA
LETVLLVDDHEMLRAVVVELLGELGYPVLAAGSGAEAMAVSAAHEGRIDLLITDLSMPEMNGEELAQRIRSQRPAIRVLYASGHPHGAVGSRDLGQGEAYLEKPFHVDVLETAIRELLDRPEAELGGQPGLHNGDRG